MFLKNVKFSRPLKIEKFQNYDNRYEIINFLMSKVSLSPFTTPCSSSINFLRICFINNDIKELCQGHQSLDVAAFKVFSEKSN